MKRIDMICKECGSKFSQVYWRVPTHSGLCRKCNMKHTYEKRRENGKLEETNQKRIKTTQKIWGVNNVAQSDILKQQSQYTCIKKYGVSHTLKRPGINEKGQKAAHSKESYEKREKTCLKKYGKKHHMIDNPEIIKKIQETYKEQTGFDHPMHNPEVKKLMIEKYGSIGQVKGYYFNNIHFDSSWELAYYIYLTDNKKQFIYHPPFTFEYIGDDGNSHTYHPDFLIEGKFYEIKGTQFFNDRGEPFNMYTKTYWWDKFNCLKSNQVIILYFNDIKSSLEYVKNTYGKYFIRSFKLT